MYLVSIFARDGELLIADAYGRCPQLGNVQSVDDICAVDADEIAIVEYRRPLRNGCFGAVALARYGVNPHLRVVALHIGDVVHHNAYMSAVRHKFNLLRYLLCSLREPLFEPYLRHGYGDKQNRYKYWIKIQ